MTKLEPKFLVRCGILRKFHSLELKHYYGAWKDHQKLAEKTGIPLTRAKRELADAQEIFKIVSFYINHLDNAIKKGKGLFLYGNSGTGKSLLLNCIAKEALRKRKRVVVLSAYKLVDLFAQSWNPDNEVNFDYKILKAPLLCVEEMNKELFNSATLPTMTRVVKYREANLKATCFTCNEPIEIIEKKYSKAIASSIRSMCKLILFDSGIDWRNVENENWERDLK